MKFRRSSVPPTIRQRNRTGESQKPATFSYYTQRSDRSVNTGRGAGREQNGPKRNMLLPIFHQLGLVALTVVIILVVISNLMLSSTPRIIPLSSSSNQYFLHSTDSYSQAVGGILSSSIWNRNKLTINTESVSQQIQKQFPELSSVSIALPLLGHRPVLYIQPSQPALILTSPSQGSFVINEDGLALLSTTQLPTVTNLDLPVVMDQTGASIMAGKQALTSSDVDFIQQVIEQLKAHQINISSITLPQAATEVDIYPAGQAYYVRLNMHATKEDARQQIGTFIAVQRKLTSQNIVPAKYIDVRVDGRAYYQ